MNSTIATITAPTIGTVPTCSCTTYEPAISAPTSAGVDPAAPAAASTNSRSIGSITEYGGQKKRKTDSPSVRTYSSTRPAVTRATSGPAQRHTAATTSAAITACRASTATYVAQVWPPSGT